jgi:hypothetical protein
MDIVQIIETLGIPVAVAFVLGYGCLYLMKFITGKLIQRIDEQYGRLESIVVKLIDSNNKEKTEAVKLGMQQTAQFSELLGRFDTFISVVQKLTGNGLKGKHDR